MKARYPDSHLNSTGQGSAEQEAHQETRRAIPESGKLQTAGLDSNQIPPREEC